MPSTPNSKVCVAPRPDIVGPGCVPGSLAVVTGGELLELMPQRSAWWGASGTLIVADLHLGKSQALRSMGAPVPGGVLEESLGRLSAAIGLTGASRLLVVGDLLHAGVGLTEDLVDRVRAWRATFAGAVVVVPGNHDRALSRVAEAWSLDVTGPALVERGLEFRHEPAPSQTAYVWSGHVHPAVSLCGGGDRVKLACFAVGSRVGLLPAFTRFAAGGGSASFEPGARVCAIAESRVVDLGGCGV